MSRRNTLTTGVNHLARLPHNSGTNRTCSNRTLRDDCQSARSSSRIVSRPSQRRRRKRARRGMSAKYTLLTPQREHSCDPSQESPDSWSASPGNIDPSQPSVPLSCGPSCGGGAPSLPPDQTVGRVRMRQRHWFVAVRPLRIARRIIEKSSPSRAYRRFNQHIVSRSQWSWQCRLSLRVVMLAFTFNSPPCMVALQNCEMEVSTENRCQEFLQFGYIENVRNLFAICQSGVKFKRSIEVQLFVWRHKAVFAQSLKFA